jgi:hypothetical protein
MYIQSMHTSSMLCKCIPNGRGGKGKRITHCNEETGRTRIAGKLQVIETGNVGWNQQSKDIGGICLDGDTQWVWECAVQNKEESGGKREELVA